MLPLEALELALEEGLSACRGAQCACGSCRRCRSRAEIETEAEAAEELVVLPTGVAVAVAAAVAAVEEEEEEEEEEEAAAVVVVVEEAAEAGAEAEAAGAEAEAEAEIRQQKAPDARDGRSSLRQPPAPEQHAAAAASDDRRARASGRARLAGQDEQRRSPQVAFRSWQSWAAVQQVPPAPAGRPRPPDCQAARVRHARSSPRLRPSLRARARAASFSPAQGQYRDQRGRRLKLRGPLAPRRRGSCPRLSHDKGRRPRASAGLRRYPPGGTGPRRSWPSS
jgi:hypothetical protein